MSAATIQDEKVKRALASARWKKNNRTHVSAQEKARLADPEKRVKRNKQQREWQKAHPDRVRDRKLRAAYGISGADYDRLLVKQHGLCAICGGEESDKRSKYLSVDHCHKTGKVRGLLCSNCNNGLGRFGDDADLLLTAVAYLRES